MTVALGNGNVFAGLHGSGKKRGRWQGGQGSRCNRDSPPESAAALLIALRRGNGIDNRLKQRTQIFAVSALMHCRSARLGVRIKDREVELVFFRVKVNKEVVNLVQHFLRTSIGRSILL